MSYVRQTKKNIHFKVSFIIIARVRVSERVREWVSEWVGG